MKKSVFLSIVISVLTVSALQAQNRYFTKEGKAHFVSKAPLEQIEERQDQQQYDNPEGRISTKIHVRDLSRITRKPNLKSPLESLGSFYHPQPSADQGTRRLRTSFTVRVNEPSRDKGRDRLDNHIGR